MYPHMYPHMYLVMSMVRPITHQLCKRRGGGGGGEGGEQLLEGGLHGFKHFFLVVLLVYYHSNGFKACLNFGANFGCDSYRGSYETAGVSFNSVRHPFTIYTNCYTLIKASTILEYWFGATWVQSCFCSILKGQSDIQLVFNLEHVCSYCLLFWCIIDERWRDSGPFQTLCLTRFVIAVHYTY